MHANTSNSAACPVSPKTNICLWCWQRQEGRQSSKSITSCNDTDVPPLQLLQPGVMLLVKNVCMYCGEVVSVHPAFVFQWLCGYISFCYHCCEDILARSQRVSLHVIHLCMWQIKIRLGRLFESQGLLLGLGLVGFLLFWERGRGMNFVNRKK